MLGSNRVFAADGDMPARGVVKDFAFVSGGEQRGGELAKLGRGQFSAVAGQIFNAGQRGVLEGGGVFDLEGFEDGHGQAASRSGLRERRPERRRKAMLAASSIA